VVDWSTLSDIFQLDEAESSTTPLSFTTAMMTAFFESADEIIEELDSTPYVFLSCRLHHYC
jgi:hypothetical protein